MTVHQAGILMLVGGTLMLVGAYFDWYFHERKTEGPSSMPEAMPPYAKFSEQELRELSQEAGRTLDETQAMEYLKRRTISGAVQNYQKEKA